MFISIVLMQDYGCKMINDYTAWLYDEFVITLWKWSIFKHWTIEVDVGAFLWYVSRVSGGFPWDI